MFDLDVERLHRDVEAYERGDLTGRQVGKTTVMIYKLLGSMEVSPPGSTIVVLAHDVHWRSLLRTRVMDEITRNKIPLVDVRETEFVTKGGVHVMFLVPDDVIYYGLGAIKLVNYFIDDKDVLWSTRQSHHTYIIDYLNTRIQK
mgnify:CR=1 FL=1